MRFPAKGFKREARTSGPWRPVAGILRASLVVAMTLIAGPVLAETFWVRGDQADTRLVVARDSIANDATVIRAGWHVRLAPGWKTYWLSPGEAGLPPSFDWSGSVNVADVTVHWPAPDRFDVFGVDTVGYAGEVMLPLTIVLEEPGKAANLDLTVDFMVCERICLPLTASYDMRLPEGAGLKTPAHRAIEHFEARVPPMQDGLGQAVPDAALVIRDARMNDKGLEVRVQGLEADADVFIAGPDAVSFGPARLAGESGDGATRMLVPLRAGTLADLAAMPMYVVVVNGSDAVAWRGEISP